MMTSWMFANEIKPKLHISAIEDVELKTSSYQPYHIGRALSRRKAALLLFPGGWDPYSVHALKVLRNSIVELAALDLQIIAVTRETPLEIKSLLEEHDIPFVIASDPDNKVAKSFEMVEQVSDALLARLKESGVFTETETGEAAFKLPRLTLLFFHADGSLASKWQSTPQELLISQEQVSEMATRLLLLPESS